MEAVIAREDAKAVENKLFGTIDSDQPAAESNKQLFGMEDEDSHDEKCENG